METTSSHDQVIGIPVSSLVFAPADGVAGNPPLADQQSTSNVSSDYSKHKKRVSVIGLVSKIREKAALGIKEHDHYSSPESSRTSYPSKHMETTSSHDQVIGIPVSSLVFAPADGVAGNPSLADQQSTSNVPSDYSKHKKRLSVIGLVSKIREKAALGIKEHGSNMAERVKGKLSLGAKMIQSGGIEKVFRQSFSVGEGERLLKAFQCNLSTTAGPISGMLFVSTEKVAFRSDKPLELRSPKGELAWVPYKVLIPIRRMKKIVPCKNSSKPSQKYIQVVTVDDFEFWFMGSVSSDRSFRYLQQATSTARR